MESLLKSKLFKDGYISFNLKEIEALIDILNIARNDIKYTGGLSCLM